MSNYVVHRCQLYKPSTSAIDALAFEPTLQKLVLSRADGSLHVYDLRCSPVLERTFILAENGQSENVIWCKKRIFSVGVSGFLNEWSLHQRLPVTETKISPSPVWCCVKTKDESMLIFGTEDGGILKCKVGNEIGLVEVEKPVARTEKRILSLAIHENGKILASGSLNEIKIWDFETGRCLHRITVNKKFGLDGRNGRNNDFNNRDTLIWSLVFTKDFVVASGDSRGVTSFWNAKHGTQICEFNSHKADVLCLAYDEVKNQIYSSGMDPAIVEFIPLKEKPRKRRISGNFHNLQPIGKMEPAERETTVYLEGARHSLLHSRDVRAMVLDEKGTLISGGVDAKLVICAQQYKRFYPVLDINRIKIAPHGNFALFQYESKLDLWKLAEVDSKCLKFAKGSGQIFDTVKDPVHYAQIKTSKSNRIISSSIDRCGDYIAYSDRRKTTVLKVGVASFETRPDALFDKSSTVLLEKMTILAGIDQSQDLPPSDWQCFCNDKTTNENDGVVGGPLLLLLACDEEKSIFVYEISTLFVKFKRQVNYPDKRSYVRKLLACQESGSTLVACFTSLNDVYIMDVTTKSKMAIPTIKLPRVSAIPMDARFVRRLNKSSNDIQIQKTSPKKSLPSLLENVYLAVAYSDGTFIEYDLEKNRYSDWAKRFLSPYSYSYSDSNSNSSTIVPKCATYGLCSLYDENFGRFLVYGLENLVSITKREAPNNQPLTTLVSNRTFQWLCHVEQLANGQLVAIQVDQTYFDKQLPQPFKTKRFGKG